MPWPGAERNYTETWSASCDLLTRYLALRRSRLIGQLWTEQGSYYLAPMDAIHAYNARQHISRGELERLVQSIELAALRKPPAEETAQQRAVCAA